MDLAGFDGSPFASRRQRFSDRFGSQPALFAAGAPRPRNYRANAYPFRAASHFLYFFGIQVPHAFGLWDGERWTLYLPPPSTDSALWHGPEPTFAELEAAIGCRVRSLGDLQPALANRSVATLPTPDRETCDALSERLSRSIRPGNFHSIDEPLVDAVIALRLIHDEAAIREMRAAVEATRAAHLAGMKATRPGRRESEVRAAMEAELIARDLNVAYGSIVTVHGEVLHNETYHHVLGPNDLLLADVGAESAGGWASDVTRTWPVSGRYSSTQKDLYDVVLRAQKATIAAVKPGIRYRDLHFMASRMMAEGLVALGVFEGDPDELVKDGVMALLFPHGIGHLLGLDVHDMEDLGDKAGYASQRARANDFGLRYLRLDRDVQPGMAITIEPGIYVVPAILENATLTERAKGRLKRDRLAAFSDVRGIRIEDDVLVTTEGQEVLTAAIPKERDAIERAMQ